MKKIKVDRKIKRTGMVSLAALLITGTAVTIYSGIRRVSQYQERELVSYDCENSAEYEVHLIPNDYVADSVCAMDEPYIYNLVDKIQVAIEANYTGSQEAEVSGNYDVDIVLRGYEYQDGEKTFLWGKKLESVESEQFVETLDHWQLNKLVPIHIRDYAMQGQAAQEELGITCSCEIAVVLQGELLVEMDGQQAQIPLNQSVAIPITEGIFSIERSEGELVQDALRVQEELPPIMDKGKVTAGAAGTACVLVLLILWIIFTDTYTSEESKRRKLEAMVGRYKNRVVEVDHFPQESDTQMIEVPNLAQLWRVADELRRPVFLIKGEEPQFMVNFLVTEGDCQYRYVEKVDQSTR